MPEPFVLLDDARPEGAADARLYRAPVDTVVAMRGGEVEGALARIAALSAQGLHVAGYLAYEAGLTLEPRLTHLVAERTGASGPLVWFGVFESCETVPAADVPHWLGEAAGPGTPAIGPLEPQVEFAVYRQAFEALHAAIEAGDIYQANLTFPLAGSWRGDPLALYAALRPRAAAGYGGVVHDGAHWHLSFSPELFFEAEGEAIPRPADEGHPPSRA